ncbi:MAG: cupin domain-containing protein [Lautropia sp.]|nr:cupin domain-containing protein [Lautropia sp.]
MRTAQGAAKVSPDREPRLGKLTIRQFLRRHWQRQPLLMRQVWPGLLGSTDASPIALSPRELFALARDPDVESRLVLAPGGGATTAAGRPGTGPTTATPPRSSAGWRLHQGPFSRLPPRRQAGWSLLVQGVDLHLPAARGLMDLFRFIPDARLDDLMISFATDGGGVGPHVDSYDVFLLQIAGRRRWQVAAPAPATLVADAPLRILANFAPQQTWLLEPGDMLYLPPGWGHDGTAVGDCLTCSIGFRSPSMAELRRAFFGFLADDESLASPPAVGAMRRYRDNTVQPAAHPAEIPADMATTLARWLRGYRPPTPLIERFIGCYLTEPKPTVWFDAPQEAVPMGARSPLGAASLDGTPLALDRRTRMLYRRNAFYINGEALEVPDGITSCSTDAPAARSVRRLLRILADQRGLDAVQTAKALRQPWLRDRIDEWLATGWLRRAGS